MDGGSRRIWVAHRTDLLVTRMWFRLAGVTRLYCLRLRRQAGPDSSALRSACFARLTVVTTSHCCETLKPKRRVVRLLPWAVKFHRYSSTRGDIPCSCESCVGLRSR